MKLLISVVFLAVGIASNFVPEKHKNWKLLRHDICGHVGSDRIIGGVEAPMNAYPWIARIGYKSSISGNTSFRCGGVLITSRTVVTAAHCISRLPDGYIVGLIRFGEHNAMTDPDCDGDFCADPVIDIPPSEIIIPRKYNIPPYRHDIALIRLANPIKFSSFVKPICLPNGNLHRKNLFGTVAEVAGWGVYNIDDPSNSEKLQVVKLPIIDNKECRARIPGSVDIGSTQLCVGGSVGQDSCTGDSGGPLMKVDDGIDGPRYFLLGVVSFGSKKCGKTDMPGVYTNVQRYTKWILDNLKEDTNGSHASF